MEGLATLPKGKVARSRLRLRKWQNKIVRSALRGPHPDLGGGDPARERQGAAARPIAVVVATTRAQFRLASGQAARGELERDGQISVEKDSRAGRRFLYAAEGAWIEPSPVST
jgi:hypothetical protein